MFQDPSACGDVPVRIPITEHDFEEMTRVNGDQECVCTDNDWPRELPNGVLALSDVVGDAAISTHLGRIAHFPPNIGRTVRMMVIIAGPRITTITDGKMKHTSGKS